MVRESDQEKSTPPYLKQFLKIKRDIVRSNFFEGCPSNDHDENALEFTAQAAAAYCLANDVKADHFNCLFRYYLVDFLKKAQPDSSNLQIAIRTGMDRRLVGNVRKSHRPTKDQIILSYLKAYCQSKKTTFIKKKGLTNSFEYFCKKGANGTMTSKVLAEELIRLGHIKDMGSRFKVIMD